ncbi:ThuA domain-containing protein [Nonomuraea rubra]|uniref:ThuA domain-containing protein n=1 Tax=Nonomuraea rubra TaxID=46180 RepID=UPI003612AA54
MSSAVLVLGLATPPAVPAQAQAPAPAAKKAAVNVLVFSGQAAQQDDPVRAAATAIRELSKKNGFSVEEAQDPAVFTAGNLARFRGVVFLSAKGVSLDEAQLAAFQAFIRGGGGFVGIRDAARAQVDSAWFTELIGTRPVGALPIAEKVVETAASAENPPNETKDKVFDGDNDTKWLARTPTAWVQGKLDKPVAVAHYALTSANDSAGRDPKDWALQGSQNGTTWTDLDKRSGETFLSGSRARSTSSRTPRRTSTTGSTSPRTAVSP